MTQLTEIEREWEAKFIAKPEPFTSTKFRQETTKYLVSTGESKKFDYIVDLFVDTIMSRFNQDISLLLVGNKGGGKSRTGLSLCYYAGCEIAERNGGRWDDYFDINRNMAVISPKRASEVMSIKDKYAVKNYDDIGIGWGARRWQKSENIEKGEVFQISRIDNQLQVFSVPNQFLLDKIPRSLVSHYAEMDQQFFDYGFTTMKLFKPTTLFREGKIIQPFLYTNRVKYVLYRIPRPPKELDDMYTKIRKDATTEAMKERLQDKNAEQKKPKRLKPDQIIEMNRVGITQKIAEGATREAIKVFLVEKGINYSTSGSWFKKNLFKNAGLDPNFQS